MKVLIIEDDPKTLRFLTAGLTESGYVVDSASDGEDGLHMALHGLYDVIVLDRMLPGRDGLSVLKMLRAGGIETPILVLSALGEVDEKVRGLQSGGDDYLTKPFSFSELVARLEALSRRKQGASRNADLQIADLTLDRTKQIARRGGKVIRLQPQEYRLLEYLLLNRDRIVTRTMLLEQVWDIHFDPQTNVIDVQISRLRGKIDRGFNPPLLHTVRGMGYKLSEIP